MDIKREQIVATLSKGLVEPKISVVGCGGAGNNVVNSIYWSNKKVETVAVKEAITRECVRLYPVEDARQRIRASVAQALRRRDQIAPYKPGEPMVCRMELTKVEQAEAAAMVPGVQLVEPGITMVNIGVGPANAKTITDHIAVLRPHAWIMLGHCAGLRNTQQLGDYVLAHGYVREDHVLDEDLPPWVPIPPLAEVQVALEAAKANARTLVNKVTEAKWWIDNQYGVDAALKQLR